MLGTRPRVARMVERDDQLRALRKALSWSGSHSLLVRGPVGSGRTRLVEEALDGHVEVQRLQGREPVGGDGSRSLGPDLNSRIVVIDDADHLNVEEAGCLAERLAARSGITVLVATAGRPLPSPLGEVIGSPEIVDVPLLSRDGAERMLEGMLDRPLDRGARSRLATLAGGNPRFLRVLLEGASVRGELDDGADGVFRLAAGYDPVADGRAAVNDSLSNLSEPAVGALGRLALARSVPLGLLGRVVSPARFAELEAAGVACLDGGDEAVVVPLVRRVVDAGLSSQDRARYASELIESIGGRHPDTPLVPATWHLAIEGDAEVLLAGAVAAKGRGDHALAERLARAAHPSASCRTEAELLLAELEACGPGRTSLGLARFSALAASPGLSSEQVARAAVGRAAGLLIGRGDPVAARRTAEAGQLASTSGAIAAEAGALAALSSLLLGDVDEALATLASLETTDGPRTGVVVGSVDALARTIAGDLQQARRQVDETATLRRAVDGHELPLWALPLGDLAATLVAAYGGELDVARRRAARSLNGALRAERVPMVGLWHVVAGHLELLVGDLDAADRACRDAQSAVEGDDPFGVRAIAICQRALIAAQGGAVHLADELLRDLDAYGVGAHLWVDLHRARAEAWCEFQTGVPRNAAKLAVEAGELALAFGAPVWAALGFHDAVRFGHPDVARAGAVLAARRCEDGLPGLLARQIHADAVIDPDRTAGDQLFAAGLRLCAAEAWLAAAVAVQDVDGSAADRLRRRAGTVLDPTALVPPTVADAIVEVPTAREREVVALVATGITSACAAEHLGVSVRTVDNHVTRALRKLGADDRHDLAWLLRLPADPVPPVSPARPAGAMLPSSCRERGRHRPAIRPAIARRRTPPPDRAHV